MKQYLHLYKSDQGQHMITNVTIHADNMRVDSALIESMNMKLVTMLTCHNPDLLEAMTLAEVVAFVDKWGLADHHEKDILECGTVDEPPVIITREHVLSLLSRDHLSYSHQGLTTICHAETIHGFQLVGQSHCQYEPKNVPALGKEMAFDDVVRQLFDMEVYRSKVYHAIK